MTAVERYPNLKVPCPNEDLGCPWKGFLKDLDGHTIPCEKQLFRAAIIDIHMMKAKLENKDREIHYLKNDFELKIRKIAEERIVKKKEKLEKVRNQTEKIGEIVYAKMNKIEEENAKQKEEIEKLKKEVAELKKEKDEENKNLKSELQSSKELGHKAKVDSASSTTSEISQQSGLVTTLPQNPTPPRKSPKVFLDMCIDGTNVGRLVIDLYHDRAPNTCDKFTKLCNLEMGVGFKGSKATYCGGDYVGIGDEGTLTYLNSSREFPPQLRTSVENSSGKHNGKGLVSMYNTNTSGVTDSYFRIIFKPCPSFDGKNVIVGKVTNGTWCICEKMRTHGRAKGIIIASCGVLD